MVSVCRYLLDNPAVCRGRTVLDLGSGCGASAIAAKLSGAAHVVANDIDAGMYLCVSGVGVSLRFEALSGTCCSVSPGVGQQEDG